MSEERSVWSIRAQEAIEQALGEVIDGDDAIATLSLATACLQAEVGELDAEDMADLDRFYKCPICTCPPDLLERGGYRGGCPVHSLSG
jgi:hypothetical protein